MEASRRSSSTAFLTHGVPHARHSCLCTLLTMLFPMLQVHASLSGFLFLFLFLFAFHGLHTYLNFKGLVRPTRMYSKTRSLLTVLPKCTTAGRAHRPLESPLDPPFGKTWFFVLGISLGNFAQELVALDVHTVPLTLGWYERQRPSPKHRSQALHGD